MYDSTSGGQSSHQCQRRFAEKETLKKKIKLWKLKDENKRKEYEAEFVKGFQGKETRSEGLIESAEEGEIDVCGRGERERPGGGMKTCSASSRRRERLLRSGKEIDRHAYCQKKRRPGAVLPYRRKLLGEME